MDYATFADNPPKKGSEPARSIMRWRKGIYCIQILPTIKIMYGEERTGRYMKDGNTAQDILKMPEERYIVAGARMFARALSRYVEMEKDAKTIKNTIHFFENRDTNELELFLYGLYERIKIEKCGKGKNEYKPTRVVPSYSSKPINPYEFVPEDEQRYKNLCRILFGTLGGMAKTIAIMSGRNKEDVLNQMIMDVNAETDGWKIRILKGDSTDE